MLRGSHSSPLLDSSRPSPASSSTSSRYGAMDFDRDNGDSIVSQIRVNINRLSAHMRELESTATSDDERARERFTDKANDSNRIAKDTNRLLQQLVQLSNTDRTMRVHRERLSDEFMQILNRLQAVQRLAERTQKEGMKKAQFSVEQDEEARRRNENAPMDSQRQLQMREQQRAHIHEIKERNEAFQNLERDMNDVATIFKDLARIVHDQGEMVDSIEDNVEHAHVHVEQGQAQLQQAVYYQSKARQKKIMLCIFLFILLSIIATTVYFYAK